MRAANWKALGPPEPADHLVVVVAAVAQMKL
jgi:hypothetical protein